MVNFNKKNIDVKTLGERLKVIREKAGISIDEIAKNTKVNKKYLEFIENDEYGKLPSEVYIKGFLRSYSNFMGIEAEDVLRIYKKERGIQLNIKKPIAQDSIRRKIKIPTVVLPLKAVAGIGMSVLFLSIGWYFYAETGKFAEAPRLLVSKPLVNTIIKETSTEIVGVTDIGNGVIVNGQSIFVNEKGEFRERISLKEGINELIIKATNKFNKEVEKNISISAQYVKEIPEINKDKDLVVNNKIALTVKTGDIPVWISVKVDNTRVYDGTMLADTEQFFEGAYDVSITSGMANKTFVKIGEEDYKQLDENKGVIRDVIFRNENNKVDKDNDKTEEGELSTNMLGDKQKEQGDVDENIED